MEQYYDIEMAQVKAKAMEPTTFQTLDLTRLPPGSNLRYLSKDRHELIVPSKINGNVIQAKKN